MNYLVLRIRHVAITAFNCTYNLFLFVVIYYLYRGVFGKKDTADLIHDVMVVRSRRAYISYLSSVE